MEKYRSSHSLMGFKRKKKEKIQFLSATNQYTKQIITEEIMVFI